MTEFSNRYDFVLLFDVENGNPNGDPDAGNLPRIDSETMHGLVTDVCLKRKVRNYVALTRELSPGYDIYVKEKAVLGRSHVKAFQELGISIGQETREAIPEALFADIENVDWPEGVTVQANDNDDGKQDLVLDGTLDKKEASDWLNAAKKEKQVTPGLAKFVASALNRAKTRKPTPDETERGKNKMCADYYDIRTFGAVMSLKNAPNCGQVRGPIQLTFATSINPVVPREHTLTRMAVASEERSAKQAGENREFGRKFTIPYGLYKCFGFVSPHLARQTRFSAEDLDLFWEALVNMFEHDRSAARGLMATRKLFVFKHDSPMGNAPAHALFKRIDPRLKNPGTPPRAFSDYEVSVEREGLPAGVSLIEMP